MNEDFKILNNVDTNQINTCQSSFLGGKACLFTIEFLGSNPKVYVCGFEGKIINSGANTYSFETPVLLSQTTVDQYKLFKPQKILPDVITSRNIGKKEALTDGDLTTSVSFSTDCEFTFDFGEGFLVYLDLIKIFPQLNGDLSMLDAVIEGTNDNITFTELRRFDEEFQEKWAEINISGANLFRYVRFRATKC